MWGQLTERANNRERRREKETERYTGLLCQMNRGGLWEGRFLAPPVSLGSKASGTVCVHMADNYSSDAVTLCELYFSPPILLTQIQQIDHEVI